MNKGEKIKIYIKINGRYYRLFNLIQMGMDGIVDLKITDYYNDLIIQSKNANDEKGYLTEDEMEAARFIHKAEISYHSDGSFLHKIKDNTKPEHSNPYGRDVRWTATNSIYDFQPILNMAIRRMTIIKNIASYPKFKNKEFIYVCENADLFENKGTYLILIYIRNKKFNVNRCTTAEFYSDILIELNQDLDLCVFIQRHHYSPPQPYYSKHFNGLITPYSNNSINFCNRDSTKDEMNDTLGKTIFDSRLHHFLEIMTDGEFINLSENKIQLIDQIDILYQSVDDNHLVSKPAFIKFILNLLKNNLVEFNKQPFVIKQSLLQQWMKQLG